MAIAAALDQNGKEPQGEKRSVWGGRGGEKKDPDLEKLCALSYLIVDDSRFARATVKNVLHVIGIRNVAESEDAETALLVIEKQDVDVVIVDFEMPGMNGAEFAWRLRRSKVERIQQLPIVMISNHADEGHINKAINSGVNEFLPKPFSQGGLYARIRRAAVSPKPFIVSEGYIGPDRRLKDQDFPAKQEQRGLPPVVLLDFTGPEPKRIEISKAAPAAPAASGFSAMAEAAAPAPAPGAGDLLSRTVDEKLKD